MQKIIMGLAVREKKDLCKRSIVKEVIVAIAQRDGKLDGLGSCKARLLLLPMPLPIRSKCMGRGCSKRWGWIHTVVC
jgi:hypothetical protein